MLSHAEQFHNVFSALDVVFVLCQQSTVSRASSTVETTRGACRVHVIGISQSQDRISASTVPVTLRPTVMVRTQARNVKVP